MSTYAGVQQAQAQLDQAKLNLSYTKIVATIDGIVSRKNVAVGANLSVGQDLLTIVPLTNLWVTANFKETQLKQMRQGQEVDLKVDALNGRKFTGKLSQIGGATGSKLSLFPPENATGNYVKVCSSSRQEGSRLGIPLCTFCCTTRTRSCLAGC